MCSESKNRCDLFLLAKEKIAPSSLNEKSSNQNHMIQVEHFSSVEALFVSQSSVLLKSLNDEKHTKLITATTRLWLIVLYTGKIWS